MGTKRTPQTDPAAVLAAAKARVAVDRHGVHGVAHWTRVRENGHRLARHTRVFGIATVADLRQSAARHQHRVALPEPRILRFDDDA